MSAGLRLLIAEDDPAFRRVIQFTLERAGWQVIAAPDGMAAAEQLERSSFDCLVTDHQMPRMSGIELIETVRNVMQLNNPEIILCTAKGLELDAQKLQQQYRLAAVLHKPFSPRQLVNVIASQLETQGLRDRHEHQSVT